MSNMLDGLMYDRIQRELDKIEEENGVHILLAVEAGSRAWGLDSVDSDYDVRFIYIRRQDDYLDIDPVRDVIQIPISDELDINGWDIRKALKLMRASNPNLFEWFSSPVVYRKDQEFVDGFIPLKDEFFLARTGIYHYLSMAGNARKTYLDAVTVPIKKYLYTIRPILACRYILENGTPPPSEFIKLLTQVSGDIVGEILSLVQYKRKHPEQKMVPRNPVINKWIDAEILELKKILKAMPEPENEPSKDDLNRFFLEMMRVVWG